MSQELYYLSRRIVRDEGGVIVPMFSQAIDAISDKVGGYVGGGDELMNRYAFAKCWLTA